VADPTVIIIKDAVLKLGATAADVGEAGTGTSFECQTTSAAINATPNLQTVPATFCAPASQAPAATGFELAITWLQDWTAPGGGLSKWAFDHDTEAMYFSLSLDPTTPPLATGQVRIVAGAYGGDAGVPLTTTATWPCPVKPTIDAPPAGAGLAAEPEGAEAEPVPEPV
jgi:hypothetical protein